MPRLPRYPLPLPIFTFAAAFAADLSLPTFAAAAMTTPSSSSSPPPPSSSRLVYGKNDALFGCIEEQQGEKPFGSVLDAGTGLHSLRWIATLRDDRFGMADYTAVTADETMQRNVQLEADELGISQDGQVVVGNWFDEHVPLDKELLMLRQQQQRPDDGQSTLFDVIIVDYLIGAMDGFSPYKQDLMIPKLAKLLNDGGRMYIVGLQPIPDSVPAGGNRDANIICKVRQVRDACILLAGHRCYREYPIDWIIRQVRNYNNQIKKNLFDDDDYDDDMGDDNYKSDGGENDRVNGNESSSKLRVIGTSRFPILYKHATILKQINVARSKFRYFPNPELATAMAATLDDLEKQSFEATARCGRIQLGFDYVVSIEKCST